MTYLLVLLAHLVPALVDLKVDSIGFKAGAGRELVLEVLPDDGAGALGIQEGGGEGALGGIRVLDLLLALALLGLTGVGVGGVGGGSSERPGEIRDTLSGEVGLVDHALGALGELETLEGTVFAREDRRRVLDVGVHQLVQVVGDIVEALLDTGEGHEHLVGS